MRPSENQIDDLMEEIQKTIEAGERTLVTTLTKRMAEELDEYLREHGIHCAYIHSDVDTLDRVRIMDELREGTYDVLVGVNLLPEGLDLPEVSLVAILDADKEGFLRNERSLTQTVGRAARNIHGRAIMYADTITGSMRRCIDETERRRMKQMKYNEANNITPTQIVKPRKSLLDNEQLTDTRTAFEAQKQKARASHLDESLYNLQVADESSLDNRNKLQPLTKEFLQAEIEKTKQKMLAAAKALDFMEAANLRDYMLMLSEKLEHLK